MSSKLDIFDIQAMQQRPDPSINILYTERPENKNNIVIKLLQDMLASQGQYSYLNIGIIKLVMEPIENEFNKYILTKFPKLCKVLNENWLINTNLTIDNINDNINFDSFVNRSGVKMNLLIDNIKKAKNIHKNDITITQQQNKTSSIEIETCKKILTDFLNNLTQNNVQKSYSNFSEYLINFKINFINNFDNTIVSSNTVSFNIDEADDKFKADLLKQMDAAKESGKDYQKLQSLNSNLRTLDELQNDFTSYMEILVEEQYLLQHYQDLEKEDSNDILQGGIITVGTTIGLVLTIIPATAIGLMPYAPDIPVHPPPPAENIGQAFGLVAEQAAEYAGNKIWRCMSGVIALGGVAVCSRYFSVIEKLTSTFTFVEKGTSVLPTKSMFRQIGKYTRKKPTRNYTVLGTTALLALGMAGNNLHSAYTSLQEKELKYNELNNSTGDSSFAAKNARYYAKRDFDDAKYNCGIQQAAFVSIAGTIALTGLSIAATRKTKENTSKQSDRVVKLLTKSKELSKYEKKKHNPSNINRVLNNLLAMLTSLQLLKGAEHIESILSGKVDKDKINKIRQKVDIETKFIANIKILTDAMSVDILLINSIFNILISKEQDSFLYYIWIKAHHIFSTNTEDSSSKMDQCKEYKIQKSTNNSNYTDDFKIVFKKQDKLFTLLNQNISQGTEILDDDADKLITKINDILDEKDIDDADNKVDQKVGQKVGKKVGKKAKKDKKTEGGLSSGERILKQGKHKLSRRRIPIYYKGSRGASRQKNTKRKSKIKLNNKTRKQRKIHYRTRKQKKINNKTRKQRKKYNSRKQKNL
jgi:hypothetical protein